MVADTLFEIQEYVKEFGEEVPEPLKITYSEGTVSSESSGSNPD